MSDYALLRAATLGVELQPEQESYCLELAKHLDYDLSDNERRKLGALIHHRSERGCKNFSWLHDLYATVMGR
jgi:hypothetical protein